MEQIFIPQYKPSLQSSSLSQSPSPYSHGCAVEQQSQLVLGTPLHSKSTKEIRRILTFTGPLFWELLISSYKMLSFNPQFLPDLSIYNAILCSDYLLYRLISCCCLLANRRRSSSSMCVYNRNWLGRRC